MTIPANARTTEPYWHRKAEAGRYTFDADAPFGLPMRPTPFYVQVTLTLPGGQDVIEGLSVEHRYEGDIFSGEKRTELLVVALDNAERLRGVRFEPSDVWLVGDTPLDLTCAPLPTGSW